MSADLAVFNFLNGITGESFLVDGIIVFFSEYLIYILTILFVVYLFGIKNWKKRAGIFAISILGVIISRGILTPAIRYFFYKPRPFEALAIDPLVGKDAVGAFPSGHIAFIVPIVIALWYINKRVGNWSFAGVIFMGIARVAAGVHWPTDIIGGLLVGTLSFIVARVLLGPRDNLHKSHKKEEDKSIDTH